MGAIAEQLVNGTAMGAVTSIEAAEMWMWTRVKRISGMERKTKLGVLTEVKEDRK